MKSLTTKLGVVGIMMISCASLSAQNFTVQSGKWSSPSVWSGGIVPDSTAGPITINHKITLPVDTVLKVDQLTLNDTLIVEAGSTLLLSNAFTKTPDLQILTGGLKVYGRLVCLDSTTTSGTTIGNTFFYDGSTYEHRFFSVAGTPPVATWSIHSNLEITGYRTTKTLNNVLWSQSFGNVIYNCPNQVSTASIEFAGRLKNINGNFLIQSSGSSYIRLSLDATTSTTINIRGDLIIEGTSRVWFSRAATTAVFVGGNFKMLSTATASSYITTTGNCEINVEGNFEMNTASIFRFASGTEFGSGTIRVNKDFLFSAGTIRVSEGDGAGIGTLEMNGSSRQLFTSLGLWTTGVNLLITNNTGVEVQENSKVEGNVVVAAGGKLLLPETNFILHGDLTIESDGSVEANQGTLTLAGLVDQSLSLAADTIHHINIDKSPGSSVTLANAVTLSGTLSVLSTNTAVHSNGNLTLLSFSDDGNADASINMLPTGSSISGNVTVQRFMSGEGRIYRYLSIPVSNASIDSLMDDFPITGTFVNPSTGPGIRPGTPSFYFYNETLNNSNGWIPYPSSGLASENFLEVGRGYSAFIREPLKATVWDVTGIVNQHDLVLPITFTNTGNPSNDGWNLVGNPYPSSIDWNAVNGWDKINVDNGIAVRDNGGGGFLYWDGEIGSLGSGRIAKGQSFWMKTNDPNPQLTIKESAKTSIAAAFYRKRISNPDYIEIIVNNSKQSEKTYLRLRSGATKDYDSLDVIKFANDFINLSSGVNQTPLAISAIDELECSQSYPLTLSFAKNSDGSFVQSPIGSYTMSINAFGIFDVDEIILRDGYTNIDTNLKTSHYSFLITADPGSFKSNRFSLLFNASVLNDSELIVSDSIICDTSSYTIQLKNTQRNTEYKIFIDDRELDHALAQQNDSLSFEFESKELNDGFTSIKVKARNLCYTKDIIEFNVWKQHTYPPHLIADLACNSETTTLRIQNAKDVVAFNWYDHDQNLLDQTYDSSFVTIIQKPTTFYAASVFDYGCVSSQSSAYADVIRYTKPLITEDHGLLYSSYSIHNQWSLNDKEIPGANESIFKPTTTGNYKLTTIHDGCVDSTSYYFTYQDEVCHVFPNPIDDDVQIVAPINEQIVQIELVNAAGQSVGIISNEQRTKVWTISVTRIPSGIYSLKIQTTKNQYAIRVSKK